MRVYVHNIMMRVVSEDPNPASLGARLEASFCNEKDQFGIIALTATSEAHRTGVEYKTTASVELVDPPVPTVDSPFALDDWFNNHVHPLLEK